MSVHQAVRRLVERSGMTEEEAVKRLRSQMSSESRVSRANVVLCTLWHPDVTQKQVRDYATQQLGVPHFACNGNCSMYSVPAREKVNMLYSW